MKDREKHAQWAGEMDQLVCDFYNHGLDCVAAGHEPMIVFDAMTSALAFWFHIVTDQHSPLCAIKKGTANWTQQALHDRLNEFIAEHFPNGVDPKFSRLMLEGIARFRKAQTALKVVDFN